MYNALIRKINEMGFPKRLTDQFLLDMEKVIKKAGEAGQVAASRAETKHQPG